MILELPWPKRQSVRIWPLFIPYLGCPGHCVFCAQEKQTGQDTPAGDAGFAKILTAAAAELERENTRGLATPELAFYGGTFTGLAEPLWQKALDFASKLQTAGLISGFRCSTRPDALSGKRLQELLNAGCKLVELGIQTFADSVLQASGRGYTGAQAIEACEMLAAAKLGPGVQLMPGLPGSTAKNFLTDVQTAIGLKAVCLRFYPTLVFRDTALARLWQAGSYRPLQLEESLNLLAEACLIATKAQIPVIRMGVASQPGLEEAILAGPYANSLGSRVQARTLLRIVSRSRPRLEAKLQSLLVPEWLQGSFWGWRKELSSQWHELGLQRPAYWQQAKIRLEWNLRHFPQQSACSKAP